MNHKVIEVGEDDATLTEDYVGIGYNKVNVKNKSQAIEKGLAMYGFLFYLMQYCSFGLHHQETLICEILAFSF